MGCAQRYVQRQSYSKQSSCVSHGKVWTPDPHNSWNGCVTDHDQNFDTTNDAPVAGATLYPAEQYGSCSVSLTQLTSDLERPARKDHRHAAGRQYQLGQTIGLQVGWQTLTDRNLARQTSPGDVMNDRANSKLRTPHESCAHFSILRQTPFAMEVIEDREQTPLGPPNPYARP